MLGNNIKKFKYKYRNINIYIKKIIFQLKIIIKLPIL